jgi:hypothetical protein
MISVMICFLIEFYLSPSLFRFSISFSPHTHYLASSVPMLSLSSSFTVHTSTITLFHSSFFSNSLRDSFCSGFFLTFDSEVDVRIVVACSASYLDLRLI